MFFKYFSEDGKDICRAPVDTGFVNVNVPPPSRGNPRDFTSESWEVDYGPSYNPDLVTENVPYVRMRTHLSRGDREAWKAQEHERIRLLEEKKRQKENQLPLLPPGMPPLEPGSVVLPAEVEGAAALPPKKVADVPKKTPPVAPKPTNGKEILRIILGFLSKLCCCCGAQKCSKGSQYKAK